MLRVIKVIKLLFLFLPHWLSGQQLGFALEQINAAAILNQGLTGKGVKVGLIDGGFLKADAQKSLQHLFDNGLIARYKDYLDSTDAAFSGSKGWDDGHGTEVLEMIAGLNVEKDIQYGLATGATYYLARTDHGGYERRTEEENAIKALEWMAREGVQIINISLGYNYGFSNKDENYQPSQMDGKSTILTRAVDRISEKYGILIIVAAGNDGDRKWRIIDSPADAELALTVGATKFKTWDDMSYSSKGPEWLPYVKPEVSCYAASGTSFSAPVITGLAACLLEKDSTLTGAELKQLIIESSSLAQPNNYIGYGVPDAAKALDLLNDQTAPRQSSVSAGKSYKLKLESKPPYLTIYHKNGWKVIDNEKRILANTSVKIKKKAGSNSSTVIWQGGSLEVLWEN